MMEVNEAQAIFDAARDQVATIVVGRHWKKLTVLLRCRTGKGFGARFLLIPGQGRWLPLVTWIPGIGQRPSQVGKTFSTY